jgi:hypothetical protein
MEKEGRGISRRRFLTGTLAVTLSGLLSKKIVAQTKDAPTLPKKSGTRVILLGTGGGPRPNKMRNQSSWVLLVNDIPYVVDCGGGVSRQLVFANIPLLSLRYIFITHHHSDHNLEYGNLFYNAWVSGFKGRIDTMDHHLSKRSPSSSWRRMLTISTFVFQMKDGLLWHP